MADPDPWQEHRLDEYLNRNLTDLISGSNAIEGVGFGYDLTAGLCRAVFAGEDVNFKPRSPEYEAALLEMVKRSDQTAFLRSKAEVIQHAKALRYIVHKIVLENEPLSEAFILKTHSILCEGIPLEDGTNDDYAGIYRTAEVAAGFAGFTPPEQILESMANLVRELNSDVLAAKLAQSIDPFMLAAKYCHKLVNIHPFIDGNGRTCRIILNAILLKYAGIVVPLGEGGEWDRDAYLSVAVEGGMQHQKDVDKDEEEVTFGPPAWAGLATLVVTKAANKMMQLKEHIIFGSRESITM